MALGTYSGMKDAVKGWLNRSDLDARIPDFIALAHLEVARDVYWRTLAAPSDAAPTNAVLTAAPDLYLHASCKHGAIYLRDAEAAAGFQTLYDAAFARFHFQDTSSADFATEDGALVLPANVAA